MGLQTQRKRIKTYKIPCSVNPWSSQQRVHR